RRRRVPSPRADARRERLGLLRLRAGDGNERTVRSLLQRAGDALAHDIAGSDQPPPHVIQGRHLKSNRRARRDRRLKDIDTEMTEDTELSANSACSAVFFWLRVLRVLRDLRVDVPISTT